MVDMINGFTGVLMTVADERVEEYLAAGHKLAALPTEQEPKEEPKKPKKTTKAKK